MTTPRRRSVLLAGTAGGLLTVLGTATAARADSTYPVAPGVRLNVRSGPGTSYPIVRVLPEGSRVAILCQSPGTTITGRTARATSGTASRATSSSRTPM